MHARTHARTWQFASAVTHLFGLGLTYFLYANTWAKLQVSQLLNGFCFSPTTANHHQFKEGNVLHGLHREQSPWHKNMWYLPILTVFTMDSLQTQHWITDQICLQKCSLISLDFREAIHACFRGNRCPYICDFWSSVHAEGCIIWWCLGERSHWKIIQINTTVLFLLFPLFSGFLPPFVLNGGHATFFKNT